MNMQKMMKQAQQMQEKLAQAQAEVAAFDRSRCFPAGRDAHRASAFAEKLRVQSDLLRHAMDRQVAEHVRAVRPELMDAFALESHRREFFHVEKLRTAQVRVAF